LLQQKIPSFLTWWEYCLTSKTEPNFFEQVKTTQVKTSTSKKDSILTPSIVAFWNHRIGKMYFFALPCTKKSYFKFLRESSSLHV
jgi:hypothetical protein